MYCLQAALNFWDKLERWDQWLFVKINSGTINPFFDNIMPYLRNANYWAPFYLFLFVFTIVNFRAKGIWWSVLFLCTVSLADIVSSHIFKSVFERIRPCQDPDFYFNVRLLVNRCSGGYSFTSSHAANHFGMAAYIFITMRKVIGHWAWLVVTWAVLIGYAQVYVGVHYPLDVLGGGALGVIFGSALGLFFNKRFGFAIFDK